MRQEYKLTQKINKEVIKEIASSETAEELVEKAKNKKSSLHSFFEWDDSKAGEKWRIQQARVLINDIKIIVDNKEIYGFENIGITLEDGSSKRVYKPIIEILSNESYRQQIIIRSLQHQKYWAEQNKIYDELRPIVSAIQKTEYHLHKKWQKKK